MPQHVTVSEYNSDWPRKYAEEREKIIRILGENCIAAYHIGSTSVPGLAAKPIIDILVAVRSLRQVDDAENEFNKLGYEYLGEFGIKGRRYLRKGGDERTHQIHIFHDDDWNNIGRHLAFRDYMRTHEKEKREYEELKKSLALKFPFDIENYCNGKEAFIRKTERLALSHFDGSWHRLYIAARKFQVEREISPFVTVGSVSAALITDIGNIYVGVSIDTACSLGMCAERNAIANMITNGERRIKKILALKADGSPCMPCGACRELIMQLNGNSSETEVMCGYEPLKQLSLKTLIPDWWGGSKKD